MEDTLTIQEMVESLRNEGFRLSGSQVWSYVEKDILPEPVLVNRGEEVFGGYPADMVEPLKRFLALRDRGIPPVKAKEALLEENRLFVSGFLGKRGMDIQKLRHFALPNIEVDESGAVRTDRGFSQFFIDLLEATLWRSGEKREEKARQMLQRQLLKWQASLDAFWLKFDKIEAGDSWEKRGKLIRRSYSEVITALAAGEGKGTAHV